MLKLENICKTYNPGLINETILYSNFSLAINNNEFVTVVGSNGSGKSSLLNIICGSIKIDSGSIKLDNKNITNEKEYKRGVYIGRVFQDPSKGTCPSMTILENMSMADNKGKSFNLRKGIDKKRTNYYKELLTKLKLGLEDKLNIKVNSLSGGQRQALALLTATMSPLELLILDEHTAALDPKISETVMELTNEIVKENNITTLMVTHNLKYAINYGSRIIMMHKGKIILDKDAQNKKEIDVKHLLNIFNEISIEAGNSV